MYIYHKNIYIINITVASKAQSIDSPRRCCFEQPPHHILLLPSCERVLGYKSLLAWRHLFYVVRAETKGLCPSTHRAHLYTYISKNKSLLAWRHLLYVVRAETKGLCPSTHRAHLYTYTHTHTHTHTNTHTHTHTHIHTHTPIIYIYTHTHLYTHTYIYIYI